MNAIDFLISDHDAMRVLFEDFKKAHEEDDLEQMQVATDELVALLQMHERYEEEIFYKAVKPESDDVAAEVDEGLEEHHVADLLMAELAELDPTEEAWPFKVKVLIEGVEHHIDEEEEELFKDVQSATPAKELDRLGAELERAKAAAGV